MEAHIRKTVLSLALALSLTACGPDGPTIDTSSEEAMYASYKKIVNSLSEVDSEVFAAAFETVAVGHIDFENDDKAYKKVEWENLKPIVQKKLEGKTVQEVIDAADGKHIELMREDYERLLEEEKHAGIIDNIQINNLKVRTGLSMPRVTFDLENNSDAVITTIIGTLKLHSPGRTLPWLEDTLYETIQGGLESGETRSLKTTMFVKNMSELHLPDDAEIQIDIERLEGIDQELLYNAESDPEERRKRIKAFKAILK